MIEADVLLRSHDPQEPIMAHPPNTDSDITLREWLKVVAESDKGIKLDFKRSVDTFLFFMFAEFSKLCTFIVPTKTLLTQFVLTQMSII